MLYFLYPLKDISIFFNLFRYITFRAAGASIFAFLFCIWIAPFMIQWLRSLKVLAHTEREHAEKIHTFFAGKKNVPSMGGIIIVVSVVVSMLLWGNLTNRNVWILIGAILWFAGVGFWDDWLKMRSKSSKGISSRMKMFGQVAMGGVIGVVLFMDPTYDKWVYLPFLKSAFLYLGWFYIPFCILVLVGTSNALNLTDGLDGLAIGCTLFTALSLGIISYFVGRVDFAQYLNISYMADGGEIAVFCFALAGASAGFLWFNCYPAEVIMGDTGSLSLGGALGTVAVLIKKELVLVIVGGVFVWEALSVMLQVASFKLTKKRIFLMSPFHHHLQLKGWPESKVTVRLWIVSMILAIIGLATLKVR